MKKFFKQVKNNAMFWVFVFVMIVFTGPALFAPGESNDRAVVTAIGVDYDTQYEVSLLTFIPTPNQGYLETTSVICGQGNTIAEAIYDAELVLGRKIGFSHAKVTIISEKLFNDDISKDIDYLGRIASLSENTILVATNETAKEFLNSAKTLEKDIGLQLDQLLDYNIRKLYVTDTSLEAFFKGYYSQVKSSIVGYLPIVEASSGDAVCGAQDGSSDAPPPTSDQGGKSNGEDQESTSGNSSQPNKKISNPGQVFLLKGGKKVAILSAEQLQGLNLINKKAVDYNISIDNVNAGIYNDSKLSFVVRDKKVFTRACFKNGIPVFSAKVVLGVELVEATEGDKNVKMNTELASMPPEVIKKLENKSRQQFAEALKVLREYGCDVIGVTERFLFDDRKGYNKFLDAIDSPDEFLKYVNFDICVQVEND